MAIEFTGTADPHGLEVFDAIEQRRLQVRTNEPVQPVSIADDQFCFPVDTACRVETSSLVFDQLYFVDVHDEDGRMKRTLEAGERYTFDGSTRFVGLSGPIKLYCQVTDRGELETGGESIHLSFDEQVAVDIGARSLHEQPSGTIVTPEDPESIAVAIAALSSALKTTSPERTWPSLRGHPPLVEVGPELDIPDVVSPPETSVTIEVPPTYRDLFTIAPLSFYLGANVEPGSDPRIHTASGTFELGVGCRLEDDVARTLKRVFLLDCIVRTEGMYPDDLAARTALEADLPFDLADTYEATLSEQLERYFSVPYDRLEPHVPRWPLTAHVPSTPDGAALLPFVVNELGIVREPRGERVRNEPPTASDQQVVRSAGIDRAPVFTPVDGDDRLDLVEPYVTDESIEHAWFGSNAPRGASKATLDVHQNQLSRGARNESIEILVVCNDAQMLDEHDVLDGTYGNRESLPFDVSSTFGASTDELGSLLESGGYDFLHYIGHATPDGLRCPDGDLDVRSLDTVDLGVFFLNACQSYEQGLALAERGAFGGVATLGDIINEHAVDSGAMLARLLNQGFPLRGALEITSERTILGDQYLIVGDGSTDIAQCDGGAPCVAQIELNDDDTATYSLQVYPTKEFRLGSITSPAIQTMNEQHLIPGRVAATEVEMDVLFDYLVWKTGPFLVDGDLHWKEEIGPPPFL